MYGDVARDWEVDEGLLRGDMELMNVEASDEERNQARVAEGRPEKRKRQGSDA